MLRHRVEGRKFLGAKMTINETNPYTPGAGHSPPYLAGREAEIEDFRKYLQQEQIMTNIILTGLRGTGKTVLMEDKYKPCAKKRAGYGPVQIFLKLHS